jgi:hypothetical protein
MREMTEYSYLVVYLPREMPRDDARRLLTRHAEYGRWELARMRLYADGSRKATLRRPVIRPAKAMPVIRPAKAMPVIRQAKTLPRFWP